MPNIDLGGNTLVVDGIRVGATEPGQSGTELTGSEITLIDGLTAGTVTASKAVTVDANKDVSSFRNVVVTNLDAGASATAGTVDIFPTTAAMGKTQIAAADNAGNTTTTITNASQSGTRTYTIPDAGASASFVLSTGTSTGVAVTSTEFGVLASASAANSGTSKAMITGTSGALTVAGALTASSTVGVTGAITPTGGVAAAGGFSVSPRNMNTGGNPPSVSTDFTDYTVVITETIRSEIFVPANTSCTGVAIFNGSAAAGNVKAWLIDSTGAAVTGCVTASTAGSGTDAYQRIPWSGGAVALKGPATYWVAVQGDNTGMKINTHTIGNFGADKQTSTVYGTLTVASAPTTFTTALGPVASLY